LVNSSGIELSKASRFISPANQRLIASASSGATGRVEQVEAAPPKVMGLDNLK